MSEPAVDLRYRSALADDLREVLRDHSFGKHLVEALLIRGIEAGYLRRPDLLGNEDEYRPGRSLVWLHSRWQSFFLRLLQKPDFGAKLLSSGMTFVPGRERTRLSASEDSSMQEKLEREFAQFLAAQNISYSELESFFGWRDGRFYTYLAQRVGPTLHVTDSGSFIVPDLDAIELVRCITEENDLTIEEDYQRWNFWKGRDGRQIPGRGQRLEFELMPPGPGYYRSVIANLYDYGKRGLRGHVAAFIQLIRLFGFPRSYLSSVPPENEFLPSSNFSCSSVPYSRFDEKKCLFGLYGVDSNWSSDPFVGFRGI